MIKIYQILSKYKYELLLVALIQHLFIGIFLSDLEFYTKVIWPINMLILGMASVGVFIQKGHWRNVVQKILFLLVLALPIGLSFFSNSVSYFLFLDVAYVIFFLFIFWEVLKFLIKPSYINIDIISACACGYFLLIEISTFLFQFFVTQNPQSFKGIDSSSSASTYMDLVYFSSITLTSIGFGDITPNAYYTKLITSFFGIVGQLYSVILVGIIISKFTSNTSNISK
ncbi:MAG: two pore domain potassium channel family protein [Cytophagales bacterium]|nr:MAG: two pore domain potassium channel family protein [Cytophagales bacterium]